jgi:hypothetical protein
MFNRLSALWKKLDESIFSQIDQFKTSQSYQKITQPLAGLDTTQQKILNYSLNVLIMIVPIFVISIMFLSNARLKSELKDKESIMDEIAIFSKKQGEIQNLSKQVISRGIVTSKSELQQHLINLLSTSEVDIANVIVDDFVDSASKESIIKVEANVLFKEFTTKNLSQLLFELLSREKVKISSLEVTRSKKSTFLSGQLRLLHFSRKELLK